MRSEARPIDARGYLHPAYAAALSEFGSPRLLPRSGGWVLDRTIPSTPFRDAMGCYPLFCCDDWAALPGDLSTNEDEMVSLSLVADPCGQHSPEGLRQPFRDVVRPFKEHRYMAAYALYATALERFTGRVRWLNLGAGAGTTGGDASDGLSRFKRGWSAETRTAYFCGRIFNRRRYAELTQAADGPPDGHFPAYRTGEFR